MSVCLFNQLVIQLFAGTGLDTEDMRVKKA